MTQSEGTEKSYVRKETPAVLASFPSLCRGNQVLKVRALQYSRSEPIIDIREFVTSELFTGFSKKGVALNLQQLELLLENLPAMIQALKTK